MRINFKLIIMIIATLVIVSIIRYFRIKMFIPDCHFIKYIFIGGCY